jgi:hypothetical protein
MGSGRRSSRPVPAIGLLLLAPWVGEFLMGSSPIQHLAAALVLLLPLYGGGALLVREIARRTGRGYPAIVLLGAAYGVIEAGLLDQSMFNPAFRDEGSEADFATLANHALGYVAGHAVWSIAVPIAMIELMAPEGSAAPWLGRKGLTAAAVLYAAGCAIVFSFIYAEYEFLASPVQLAGAAVAAVLLAAAAFAVDRGRAGGFSIGSLSNGGISKDGVSGASGASNPGALPNGRSDAGGGVRPLPVGIGAFAASSAFVAHPENGWAGLAAGLLLLGAAWVVVRRWSRSPWWTVRHRLALVSGALLTYAWLGFVVTHLLWPENRIAWFGNALFALVAIALVAVMARRTFAADKRGNGATFPADGGKPLDNGR